jgi:hypothetical protein
MELDAVLTSLQGGSLDHEGIKSKLAQLKKTLQTLDNAYEFGSKVKSFFFLFLFCSLFLFISLINSRHDRQDSWWSC